MGWIPDAPPPSTHRITLTLPVLNAAHQVAFIALGSQKAEAVAESLDRSVQTDVPMEEDRDMPAALVKTSTRPVVWFVDADGAGSGTDYDPSEFDSS